MWFIASNSSLKLNFYLPLVFVVIAVPHRNYASILYHKDIWDCRENICAYYRIHWAVTYYFMRQFNLNRDKVHRKGKTSRTNEWLCK
jgi:hypothetical protein